MMEVRLRGPLKRWVTKSSDYTRRQRGTKLVLIVKEGQESVDHSALRIVV